MKQKDNSIKDQLLKKLIAGNISDQELHQLEKWSHDDPFLADALEGYFYHMSKDNRGRIAGLERRIEKRLHGRKIRPIFAWSLSAAVILVLISFWWIYFPSSDSKSSPYNTEMLSGELMEEQGPSDNEQIALHENNEKIEKEDEDTHTFNEGKKQSAKTRKKSNSSLNEKKENEKVLESPPMQIENNDEENNTVITYQDDQAEKDKTKEIDESNEPPGEAEKLEEGSYVGYHEDLSVMEKAEESDASNVPVAKSRKSKDYLEAESQVVAYPAIGFDSLTLFIKNNFRSSESMEGRLENGEYIELQFTIDEEGNPGRFNIVKSICKACDLEAIRLVKAGGKWISNPGYQNEAISYSLYFD